jgi:hypothetical protein
MLSFTTFAAGFLGRSFDMIKHSASVRQLRFELAARFDKIRNLLLTDRYAPQLSKPLAHWALPADRRLPRALLHRSLGDLLRTPYDSLAAVPGIGQKKMQSLMKLLDRALHTDELEKERLEHIAPQAAIVSETPVVQTIGAGDPANISEVTWATWRNTVLAHNLGHEPLGCFAGSLGELPRVIWSVPLEHYAGLTLEAIRKLKTHGEKRVRCVVTIFGQLHSLLDGKPTDGRIQVRLTPPRIETLEKRVEQMIAGGDAVTVEWLREQILEPLVTQIGVDAGEQTAVMLRGRLGLDGAPLSVRRTAMRMRLTRARIYQLLEDAATVVDVRWPKGKAMVRQLLDRTSAMGLDSAEHRTLRVIAETFFPTEFRPAPTSLPFVRRYESQQGQGWTHTSPMRAPERIAASFTAGMR